MESQAIFGDCLEVMPTLPDRSIGMILADLPYGVTACHWDQVIPLDRLWEQFKRLIQPKRAIVLTATQPFTTDLINSNREWFKYCWVWDKNNSAGFVLANKRPFLITEDVLVFGQGDLLYNPQMEIRGNPRVKGGYSKSSNYEVTPTQSVSNSYYPKNVLCFSGASQNNKFHPTQKPIALFEYLIRTYTNEGDTVLDPTAGSMTTAIAALNTNRRYICIEKDPDYFRKGRERIQEWHDTPKQIALPIETPTTSAIEPIREQLQLFG